MLGEFSSNLKDTLKKIAKLDFLSDAEVNNILKELQRAMLRADVSFEVVTSLSENIRNKMKEEIKGLTKKQRLITLIYEEIVQFMGEGLEEISINKKPFKIMLIGLFGSGKTSTTAKLAKLLKSKGYTVCMVSLDNYRPAAFEQLTQLGEKNSITVYGKKELKKQLEPWKKHENEILRNDIVLIDTAGRDSLHENFLKELNELNTIIKPEEILLVVPAEIGQGAKELTQNFQKILNITGIIVTKLDTSAKGGGALTSSYITKKPVRYITIGESISDIELFKPKRFVSRLLGMGDIESLLEKVEQEMGSGSAEDLTKKIMSGKSDFIDFYEQIVSINKMGGIKKIFSMMPQMPGLKLDNAMFSTSKEKIDDFKYILQSMTQEELKNPGIIDSLRIRRIAKGSGHDEKEVRELIKSHSRMNKMSRKLNTRQLKRMMNQFGGGL